MLGKGLPVLSATFEKPCWLQSADPVSAAVNISRLRLRDVGQGQVSEEVGKKETESEAW